jgi:hypothetical protein
VFGTFTWIDKAAHSAALCASGAGSCAVMDANLDHHGVEFAGSGDIDRADICLNDVLELVIGSFEGVNLIGIDASTGEESAGVGIDNE